jgi:hypothetical protein
MSDTIKFQCNVKTTNSEIPLGFEVLLDDKSVYKNDHVKDTCQVMFDIDDNEATHKLKFVMAGKTADHTKIDDQGNITSDALLRITNVVIDDIDISLLVNPKSTYSHNFNGSQSEVEDKFYGDMGCNGTVTFEFTTPFYLWLLENM